MDKNILISFLITHYNRPFDLLKCLESIRALDVTNLEIVVSDDYSSIENLNIIKKYDIDKLVLSEINNGLAANINKGLKVCEGQYVLYCQEDFILNNKISELLPELFEVLDNGKADIIRFTSNCQFKKMFDLTENISLIPKFSFQNFLLNFYQYSDHPFITRRSFFDTYGYYLKNTSGDYGETEYAIRIFNSKAKIALTNNRLVTNIKGSKSVIDRQVSMNRMKSNKSIIKFARALRLYFEWLFYNKSKRGLITYKNRRK